MINSPYVLKFIDEMIFGATSFPTDTPTIGIVEDGKVIAGVAYTMYTGNGICMHVAASKQGWLNRTFLRMVFGYPFIQLGCTRVTGLVRSDNPRAQHFDERLGFVREGVIRKGDDDGMDLILYGMLKDECRWIK